MIKNGKIIRRVTEMLIEGKLNREDAAQLLDVSVRTIQNYVKWYLEQGPDGLVDNRRGCYRKLNPHIESQIIACKLLRPQRSAQWIRNWLKLKVSSEAVRRVLVKHQNHIKNV